MRTAEQIQSDVTNHAKVIYELKLEVLLDSRELLIELKDAINECKEELQEIKENTAGGE